MGRTIYLTESQVIKLAMMKEDAGNEVTYYQFRFPCLHFINSLLKDPNPARANLEAVFTENSITKEQLEKSLRKHSILSSKQRISDDQGDGSAHYVRRYIRNSDNLEAKLRGVYDELFGKKDLDECAGATSCGSVGAGAGLTFPAFATVRRPISSVFTSSLPKKKKKKKKK